MAYWLRGSALTWSLILSALVASCATQAPSQPKPAAPSRQVALPNPMTSDCIVLLGGGGTITANETVNDRWFAIDGAVERALMRDLIADGYRVHDYIVNIPKIEVRLAGLMLEEQKTGCGQVLEVTHELVYGREHAGLPHRFGFLVQVGYLHIPSPSARTVTFVGLYHREYSYPLTRDVMQNLSLSGLGKEMATNLESAGVLRK